MQRKHLILFSAASALLFSTGAVAKPTLKVDTMQGANFSNYNTYNWVSTTPSGGINPVGYQKIMANLDTRVAAKGYTRGDPADLNLALTIGKRQRVDLDAWNHWGYHDAYDHTEGEVTLDVYDAKTKQALWHGQITDAVNPKNPDPEKVDAALAQLMEQFPTK